MRAVIVASWRSVRPGQERSAAHYAREVSRYWTERAGRRLCSEPTWRWRSDGTGYWFVEGSMADLLLLSAATKARWQRLEGPFVLERFQENLYVADSRKRHQSIEALLREDRLI